MARRCVCSLLQCNRAVCIVVFIVCNLKCIVSTAKCAVSSVQFTVCCIECSVCIVVISMQCAIVQLCNCAVMQLCTVKIEGSEVCNVCSVSVTYLMCGFHVCSTAVYA